jgi:hypothetical protein
LQNPHRGNQHNEAHENDNCRSESIDPLIRDVGYVIFVVEGKGAVFMGVPKRVAKETGEAFQEFSERCLVAGDEGE